MVPPAVMTLTGWASFQAKFFNPRPFRFLGLDRLGPVATGFRVEGFRV